MIAIVMGVSGCGKSTVGRTLADALGWPFVEGDSYHSEAEVAQMARGVPLTDAQRGPWLARLRAEIDHLIAADQSAVMTCSALKRAYRTHLRGDHGDVVRFVYLKGSYDLIHRRMEGRAHFFSPEMLRSQFDTLEEPGPDEALTVSIDQPVADIVAAVRAGLAGD